MRGRNIRIFYDAELELFESLQFCPMSDRSEALKEEISKSGPVISRSYQSSTNGSGNFPGGTVVQLWAKRSFTSHLVHVQSRMKS